MSLDLDRNPRLRQRRALRVAGGPAAHRQLAGGTRQQRVLHRAVPPGGPVRGRRTPSRLHRPRRVRLVDLGPRGWTRSRARFRSRRTTRTEWLWLLAAGAVGTVALTFLLGAATDSTVPFWDALTTALSLTATYGQCKKLVESWWLWIAADVVYIPLYALQGALSDLAAVRRLPGPVPVRAARLAARARRAPGPARGGGGVKRYRTRPGPRQVLSAARRPPPPGAHRRRPLRAAHRAGLRRLRGVGPAGRRGSNGCARSTRTPGSWAPSTTPRWT